MGSITIHTKLLFSASDFSAQIFFRHLECHFTAVPNHFLCSSSFSFIPVNEIILKYEEDINYIAALILLMLWEESCPIGFWDSGITILKIRATLYTVQIFLFSFDYCFIRLPSLSRKSKLGKLSVVLISSYYLIDQIFLFVYLPYNRNRFPLYLRSWRRVMYLIFLNWISFSFLELEGNLILICPKFCHLTPIGYIFCMTPWPFSYWLYLLHLELFSCYSSFLYVLWFF